MRNSKRFLSLILAVLMAFSALVFTAGASESADYTDAAHQLAAIGILKGDENGNLMLGEHVNRYQAALFFVQAITGKTDPSVWNAEKSAIFSDVPEYGTAIDYLAGLGLIIGRGDGTYGYHDNITYQDMLVLAVRTLGYETEGMSYPYGYILEAQKLGLTDNIENVNFKSYLTRGETAQLVWDMLGTEIAFVDPLTGALVYPGKQDESAYGVVVGPGKIKRETYLEKAGFASGKLTVTVLEFTAAKSADDVDTVTVLYGGERYTMAASDLGIDQNTPKIDYLGLPLTVFADCKADEFFTKYDIDPDDSDARVVFVNTDSLHFVENLLGGGNIRYTKPQSGTPYITLGGVKFALDKYESVLYTFGENGWSAADMKKFEENFLYDTKDGNIGKNSNGAVRYIVRESERGGETVKTLHIYYMPYEFGQYFVRELKDATTGKNANFATLGTHSASKVENLDGEMSNFVEYLVGTNTRVSGATTSVSKKNGEKAKSLKLDGKGAQSGDFVFYYYNSLDNILSVAANYGGFKYGKLTGTTSSKETVKIGGTDYGFGFSGAFGADFATYAANGGVIKSAIEGYEGKENVKFVSVGGSIVYLDLYDGEEGEKDYPFAVVSFDKEILADLLDTKADKLDYTADFVLDEKGNVYAAVLNTASGKWELCTVQNFGMDYDAGDDEYVLEGNIGALANYVSIVGESYSKYGDYVKLSGALLSSNIFAVTAENDGVLSLGTASGVLESATVSDGLIFSDNSNKTNHIKADPTAEAARVSLNDNSVIVIIDANGNVGIRRGAQKYKFTVNGSATYYAASQDLIVAYFAEPVFVGGFANASDWGESRAEVGNKTYFVALPDSEAEFAANDEGAEYKYTVTVTNLFDLREMAVVERVVFYTDKTVSLNLAKVLYMDEEGTLTESELSVSEAFAAAMKLRGDEKDITYIDIAPENLTFTDADTVIVSGGALALPNALAAVNANVVTLDLTDLDREKYDFDRLALNVEYSENGLSGNELEIFDGVYGYEYPLYGDVLEVINEPAEGIFDQFIIDSVGGEILVPLADADGYEGAAKISVTLKILAHYDEDNGTLTLNVAKILQ